MNNYLIKEKLDVTDMSIRAALANIKNAIVKAQKRHQKIDGNTPCGNKGCYSDIETIYDSIDFIIKTANFAKKQLDKVSEKKEKNLKRYQVSLLKKGHKDENDKDGFSKPFEGKTWKEILQNIKNDYPEYSVVDHWRLD